MHLPNLKERHLTSKLKKAQWLPQSIGLVGINLHKEGGNAPAKAKAPTLKAWKQPETRRDILTFVGFAIFCLKWLPWFEIKAQPLKQLSAPIPQQVDDWKQLCSKTDLACF